jgi:ribonuclease HI
MPYALPNQQTLIPALGNQLPYPTHDPDTSNVHFHLPKENAAAPGALNTPEGRAMRTLLNKLRLSTKGVPPVTAPALATDGTAGENAAAAAILSDGRDEVRTLATSTAYPAKGACSYTAELAGAIAGLLLVITYLETHPDTRYVLWITDSLSVASALAKGALRQTGTLEAKLWSLILRAAKFTAFHVLFVYSHVGQPLNAEADRLAKEASEQPRPPTAETREVWFDYAARLKRSIVAKAHDDVMRSNPEGAVTLRLENGPRAPRFAALDMPTASQPMIHDICRLRCGVHAHFGYTQQDLWRCPTCGDDVPARGGQSVRHLFDCPHADAIATRDELGITGIRDLWTSPLRALDLFYKLTRMAVTD